jgi:hypothetical protein
MPTMATRGRPYAARIERPSNAIKARCAGRLWLFHDGGKVGSALVGARLVSFAGGALSRRNDVILRHDFRPA